ncbi:MAG: endonuclease [Firmicutes bacterium]|nr:endonuclease [Bacillota bacterium]
MVIKRVIKGIIIFIAAVLLLVAGLLVFLTATEYKPADVEPLKVNGTADATYSMGDSITILSWNIGYGALGDNADFFMDGGKMVKSADEGRVLKNMDGIMQAIEQTKPDIFLLQEIDRDSDRSYNIDELAMLRNKFKDYESTYGINYKTPFVPYPMPPLGKINAGIATFSDCHAESVERIQLPVPFKWPVRPVNLKRCVAETHIPLYDSENTGSECQKRIDKDLVIFNLHLEAYDSGAGKIAQTKMLAELLNEELAKGNYVIAGGDFNQIFSSADKDAYPPQPDKWLPGELDEEQFGDGWVFLMDEKTPSCRSLDQPLVGADLGSFQFYLIDGFIVSDNIQIDDLKTMDLGFVNADHNPVVLQFTLR